MGSYNYAGCLTLPRVLHCTEDGRLVQVGGWVGVNRGWVGCKQGRQQAQYCCVPACLPAAARDPPPATRPALTCPCPSPPTLPLACCPSLPLQAPIPELAQLRQGPG